MTSRVDLPVVGSAPLGAANHNGKLPEALEASGVQIDFRSWAEATCDPSEIVLGVPGFTFDDLFDPAALARLSSVFEDWFKATDASSHARFDAYRASRGSGMSPEDV